MLAQGSLRKLDITANAQGQAFYALRLDDQAIPLNGYLGATIRLDFQHLIHCIHCSRLTNKSFSQGYCYPCFRRLACCDTCIMSPERCHYAQGTCREPAWGEQHCFAPHIVYLANSSALKVGITKPSQMPIRWLDQGATQAVPILDVESRFQSGVVEDIIRQQVSDRTAWQAMLKGTGAPVDLTERRDAVLAAFAEQLDDVRARFGPTAVAARQDTPLTFQYPVLTYPTKIRTHNFDKQALVEGQLLGMKGQYLMLDTGVINLRKFAGYRVSFSAS